MPDPDDERVPAPQGTAAGMPYDWRRPTWARVKARVWNPDDRRLFTPKAFGWGYDLNLHRLVHWRRR
ncbi:hypothetical protein GV794_23720 [Nocardia cyriacigeorgica]|uniref:DUF5808 domain-containing protein n=1 Tax=Nocardia cyriacigeorgica TaxID=135487 RepID=A0ABX0CQ57_9NOCA|nr:DUF5808 domain-containing protein [Nocardia cyriacigeorgica]NEW38556.1 hypothetical protein [Nocardia cyriacigeorgica]NEW49583.1 hypothetical protein [Nocardia cyriacigeorgica]NEW58630.1 hypothetical protein [Nocardia cyriacigeorgica]